jgi:hypothetical protein
MRNATHHTLFLLTLGSALVTGCGGGGGGGDAQPGLASPSPRPVAAATSATTPAAAPEQGATIVAAPAPPEAEAQILGGGVQAPPATLSPTPPPTALEGDSTAVTDVRIQSTSAAAQSDVPVTFGHVFAPGHIGPAQTVVAKLADGSTIALQVDAKARHADGSLRHAVLSLRLPQLAANTTTIVSLGAAADTGTAAPTGPAALLDAGFQAAVNLDLAGVRYSASADSLLRSGAYKTWLSGAVSNEWLVSAPLTNAAGVPHPHLTARFAIRAVGTQRARVDVTIENAWAFEAAPQNFTYDAAVLVGGASVFTKAGLNHYHHARWRKVFWWGGEPQIHVRHNIDYLIASKAVPNYDRRAVVPEAKLALYKTNWTGAKVEPMGIGLVNPYMPSTGGRDELGIMPAWYASYVLTMDKRVKDATLGSGDLAGSWSSHYRDKLTDRPVSLVNFPYMTIAGNRGDTVNPVTKVAEAFPLCATTTSCTTPYVHDTSHQAGFAYLPYLVTGDYYYLEELQFWTMYNTFSPNPAYREYAKGLFKPDQVRGQGWSMRTLAEAAYITPDADPLKQQFNNFMKTNIDWYDANYTNVNAPLGALTHGYAIAYDNGTGLAPWMDDFFTAAIGHTVELGFTQAKNLLIWKAAFPVSRMTGANACWVHGAAYSLKVRDSATSPLYTTIGAAATATQTAAMTAMECGGSAMATALGLKVGEMTGYSAAYSGYPSNMQPALAYAADALGTPGAAAWAVFMARSVKPDYGQGPQFAIVPR